MANPTNNQFSISGFIRGEVAPAQIKTSAEEGKSYLYFAMTKFPRPIHSKEEIEADKLASGKKPDETSWKEVKNGLFLAFLTTPVVGWAFWIGHATTAAFMNAREASLAKNLIAEQNEITEKIKANFQKIVKNNTQDYETSQREDSYLPTYIGDVGIFSYNVKENSKLREKNEKLYQKFQNNQKILDSRKTTNIDTEDLNSVKKKLVHFIYKNDHISNENEKNEKLKHAILIVKAIAEKQNIEGEIIEGLNNINSFGELKNQLSDLGLGDIKNDIEVKVKRYRDSLEKSVNETKKLKWTGDEAFREGLQQQLMHILNILHAESGLDSEHAFEDKLIFKVRKALADVNLYDINVGDTKTPYENAIAIRNEALQVLGL
jgi:hypothetical protein